MGKTKINLGASRMLVSFNRRVPCRQNKTSGDFSKWFVKEIPSIGAVNVIIIH